MAPGLADRLDAGPSCRAVSPPPGQVWLIALELSERGLRLVAAAVCFSPPASRSAPAGPPAAREVPCPLALTERLRASRGPCPIRPGFWTVPPPIAEKKKSRLGQPLSSTSLCPDSEEHRLIVTSRISIGSAPSLLSMVRVLRPADGGWMRSPPANTTCISILPPRRVFTPARPSPEKGVPLVDLP